MMKGPAYARVYNIIKREIEEGEHPVGSLLPAEPELEKRFSVSRTTIRRAMDLLARDGLIRAQQGYGTTVLDYKTRQNLNGITSISETMRRRGHNVSLKSIYVDVVEANPHVRDDLKLAPGEKVARVQRILMNDGHPLAIMKNYIPYSMVPGIENRTEEIQSLYQFLEDYYGISIESAHDNISARNADFTEAQMLDVAVGTALLYLRRVCFADGRAVCVDRCTVLGDRYEFEVNLIGRTKPAIK